MEVIGNAERDGRVSIDMKETNRSNCVSGSLLFYVRGNVRGAYFMA